MLMLIAIAIVLFIFVLIAGLIGFAIWDSEQVVRSMEREVW